MNLELIRDLEQMIGGNTLMYDGVIEERNTTETIMRFHIRVLLLVFQRQTLGVLLVADGKTSVFID